MEDQLWKVQSPRVGKKCLIFTVPSLNLLLMGSPGSPLMLVREREREKA